MGHRPVGGGLMGGKNTPQAPAAPDPTVVANAQATANQQTAAQQQKLNMINSSSPYGTVNYVSDPNAPGGYSEQTTLSPSQQALYDQSTGAQSGALGVANQQIGRVGQALSQGLDPMTGGLQYGVNIGPIQSSFDQGGPIQTSYGAGGPIQSSLSGTTMGDASVQQAINAAYGQATSRLDPQWQQQRNQLDTGLANQGLAMNSSAAQTAEDNFSRAQNDAYGSAYNSAVSAGQAEQQQLFNQGATAGQFANAAQLQGNQENQQAGTFNNAAVAQQYQQNLGAADFANQAQSQLFNEGAQNAALNNAAIGQAFSQSAQAQELPINEFSALLGSGQVQAPQVASYTPTQVAPTNVLGAYALNNQAQQSAYQDQMQQQSGLMGGLFSLGSAALGAWNPLAGIAASAIAGAK